MERVRRKVLLEIRRYRKRAERMTDAMLLYAIEELARRCHGGHALWGMKLQDVWVNLYDGSSDPRIVRLREHKA